MKTIFLFLEKLFRPPIFEDEEQSRKAAILHWFSISTLVCLFLALAFHFAIDFQNEYPLFIICGAILISLVLNRQGRVGWAGGIMLWTILTALFYLAVKNNGLHDTALYAIPGSLVIAGAVFDRRHFIGFAITTIVAVIAIGYFEMNGVMRNLYSMSTTIGYIADLVVILSFTSVGIGLLSSAIARKNMNRRQDQLTLRERGELTRVFAKAP
ncbi:MAG: hypothetical protein WAO19_11570, partial [Candidatus Kryptoniota bacterium]